MKKQNVFSIAFVAIMAALSIALQYVSIEVGIMKITFYGLPLMFVGFTFGPIAGLAVGVVSGMTFQLIKYGASPLMFVYLLANVAWATVPGLVKWIFKMKSTSFEKKGTEIWLCLIVFVTSLLANVSNTIAMLADQWLENDFVLATWPWRLLIMLVMVVPYSVALLPLLLRVSPLIEWKLNSTYVEEDDDIELNNNLDNTIKN